MWIAVAAIIVVGGGVAVAASSGGGDGSKPLLVTEAVRRRDLRDEVTVQGTLGRVEQRTINAATSSDVSRVYSKDGATLATDENILALDGRASVTADGSFPFFRKLDVGAQGSDVLQLEQVLEAAGFSPGRVDTVYTTQTRFALAQWQAAHDYPGAAPQTTQSVNVALQQGSGYKLGAENSVGATIGPPAPARSAALGTSDPSRLQSSTNAVMRRPIEAAVPIVAHSAVPASVRGAPPSTTLTIQAVSAVTAKGTAASFVVQANPATHPSLQFTVSLGGTAGANDVVTPSGPFTLGTDVGSTTIQVQTIQNNLVEPNKTLVVSLDEQRGLQRRLTGVGDHDDPVGDGSRAHHQRYHDGRGRPDRDADDHRRPGADPGHPRQSQRRRQRGRRHRLPVLLAGGVPRLGSVVDDDHGRDEGAADGRSRQAHRRVAGAERRERVPDRSRERRDDHDPGCVRHGRVPGGHDPAEHGALSTRVRPHNSSSVSTGR